MRTILVTLVSIVLVAGGCAREAEPEIRYVPVPVEVPAQPNPLEENQLRAEAVCEGAGGHYLGGSCGYPAGTDPGEAAECDTPLEQSSFACKF